MAQCLVFGIADPFRSMIPGATTQAEALACFAEDWQSRHLQLQLLPWSDLIGDGAAREGTVLGIIIAATNPVDFGPGVVAMDPISQPPAMEELLDLRLVGGIQQATVDWELVRLTARLLNLELPNGHLFVLNM